jgi:hypothetical protein
MCAPSPSPYAHRFGEREWAEVKPQPFPKEKKKNDSQADRGAVKRRKSGKEIDSGTEIFLTFSKSPRSMSCCVSSVAGAFWNF